MSALTIDVPPRLRERLLQEAAEHGWDVEEYSRRLLEALFQKRRRSGARTFSREVLTAIFREGYATMKGSSLIDDWIVEAREEEARRMALRVLGKRFGELPGALVERIQSAEAEWRERLLDRAMEVESIEQRNVE